MLCKQCNQEFQPVRYDAKYCSTKCRTASHRKAKAPKEPPHWIGQQVNWRKSEKMVLAFKAAEIVESYDTPLTVRQLYYQLVAANAIPNSQKSYKSVVTLLLEARQNGIIDWDKIEDRGRNIVTPNVFSSVNHFKSVVRSIYDEDRWQVQDKRVAVIIEKHALSGLIEPLCRRWHVPFIAAGGYLSMTLIKDAAQIFDGYTILYAGDHDGSGQDMPRHLSESLMGFGCFADVKPIALTYDQVRRYNLVPNKMKESDARSAEYYKRHGFKTVWELDALPPNILQEIIENEIKSYIDMDKWKVMEDQVNERRERL
jgi:hypothetical protein